ncbi:FkbM family methyltransferase [uncultured Salegentibacter sp.]|uniref:FkbM family methyltransferase n=1 Tax=uncultured Salegentibacter sp. TaxID=259320 RepID=UPI00259AB2AA|nr:FkbM family methyltransferase [uncultured Salegentibacter sp.]
MGFNKLKGIILKLTPQKIINLYKDSLKSTQEDFHSIISYSQEGEDLILKRLFEDQKTGFYVDVGAHHPQRFSNTYLFYKMGWRGINIDAMPGCMKKFNDTRPEDINIEAAISDKDELLKYYIFNEPALNTFSSEQAMKKNGYKNFKVISEEKIKTKRLENILDKFLKDDSQIDFLTIDVENFEMKVLKSNNWERYKPKVLVIEKTDSTISEVLNSELYNFLYKKNYELFAKSFNSLFLVLKTEKALFVRK